MLSSSLDTLLKVSKTTSQKKLFDYDCVTLYIYIFFWAMCNQKWYMICKRKSFFNGILVVWSVPELGRTNVPICTRWGGNSSGVECSRAEKRRIAPWNCCFSSGVSSSKQVIQKRKNRAYLSVELEKVKRKINQLNL